MRVRPTSLAALLLVLTAGCRAGASGGPVASATAMPSRAAAMPSPAAASTSPSAGPTPLRTCGSVPTSSGATAATVGITAAAPATATSGSTLTVKVHLHSLDGKRHLLTTGHPQFVLVRNRAVVGQYEGGVPASALGITVPASTSTSLDASGLVSGCVAQPIDYEAPDLTRKALPPGSYDFVVVLEDVTAKPWGNLVSAPVPLEVIADPHALPSCGDVPVPDGEARNKIGAALTAPATGASGSTVPVQVLLRSSRGKAEPLESGLPIEVLIVKDGFVVGRSNGPIAGAGIVVTVPPSGTVPLIRPDEASNRLFNPGVTLSGCPQTSNPAPTSPSPRKPLPPGTYQLVADFGDGTGTLVANPASITVTTG